MLILLLIPFEEDRLTSAYGAAYVAYRQRVNRLIPAIY
jgi:protein-S-isoprenylcysteine O-methyltransferase Ste14